jgi:hypothetical protein
VDRSPGVHPPVRTRVRRAPDRAPGADPPVLRVRRRLGTSENARVNHQQPIARGLTALIPTAPTAPVGTAGTAGERAAAQLLHLREVSLPVPVVAAAVELITAQADDPDPVTREVAAAVLAHLTAALAGPAG